MHQIDHAASHLPCRSRDKHPDQMPSSSRSQSPLRHYQLRGTFTGSLLPYRLGWAFASTATDTALQQEPQYHDTPYPTPSPSAVRDSLWLVPRACLTRRQRYSVQALLAV